MKLQGASRGAQGASSVSKSTGHANCASGLHVRHDHTVMHGSLAGESIRASAFWHDCSSKRRPGPFANPHLRCRAQAQAAGTLPQRLVVERLQVSQACTAARRPSDGESRERRGSRATSLLVSQPHITVLSSGGLITRTESSVSNMLCRMMRQAGRYQQVSFANRQCW